MEPTADRRRRPNPEIPLRRMQSASAGAVNYTNTSYRNPVIYDLTDFEETNWWNPDVRKGYHRPGSGVLASVLAEELHRPYRSLFSVNVATLPPSQASPALQEHSSPPSKDEVVASLPHPNAYYCPEENGWVVLTWMSSSSSFATLLAQPYFDNPDFPLLYDWRRQQKVSCAMTGNPHHFHRYEKAVDGHKLTPPFSRTITTTQMDASYWKGPTTESDFTQYKEAEILTESSTETAGDEDGRLDLSVCCQCPFYCVTSKVIPGVIPVEDMEALVQVKKSHVPQGWSRERAVVRTFETLLKVIENKLWNRNNRCLKVMSSEFQINLGWNLSIKHIFTLLGFMEEVFDWDGSMFLQPPDTDRRTFAGRENRHKLLRAWVELSAWLLNFKHLHASHPMGGNERKLYVELNSAKDMYLTAIGAYPNQDASLNDKKSVVQPLEAALRVLGLSPTTFSGDLIVFAYLAQCRCDPARIPEYFTSLVSIVTHLQKHGNCPSQLQDLLTLEQSRGRFSLEDIKTATFILGFGGGNILGLEYDANQTPEELVEKAWKDCIERNLRDLEGGSETSKLCTKAFKILAQARGSVRLMKLWEHNDGSLGSKTLEQVKWVLAAILRGAAQKTTPDISHDLVDYSLDNSILAREFELEMLQDLRGKIEMVQNLQVQASLQEELYTPRASSSRKSSASGASCYSTISTTSTITSLEDPPHLAYNNVFAVNASNNSLDSIASSRTVSTDYGLYYTRWAISQETVEDDRIV